MTQNTPHQGFAKPPGPVAVYGPRRWKGNPIRDGGRRKWFTLSSCSVRRIETETKTGNPNRDPNPATGSGSELRARTKVETQRPNKSPNSAQAQNCKLRREPRTETDAEKLRKCVELSLWRNHINLRHSATDLRLRLTPPSPFQVLFLYMYSGIL